MVVTIDGEAAGGGKDLEWPAMVDLGNGIPADQVRYRELQLDTDDPINIQYTSGTTGNPKGATLTHHNILNNAQAMARNMGYRSIDRVCIPVPLYHCFGMGIGNLGCIASGSTMVYPAAGFDPLATLEALAEEQCTAVYGVPTMFIAMLEHPRFAEFDTSSLRTGIMAGAPCPVEVMKRVVDEMHAHEICIGYGMTETAPVSFVTRREDDIERRVSTVGTVLPNVEGKVVDPASGHTVPVGTPGEVCTRGYLVMRGYWDNPEATDEAIDEAGWMHTGDLGVMDAAGLPQHRRPHQGHGHPRRREPLPARDRGAALPASRRCERASDRRARCPHGRRAHGVDRAAGRRRGRPTTSCAPSAGSESRTSRCRGTSRSRPTSR